MKTARELLADLLAATPAPPHSDGEPLDLLDAARDLVAARERILELLKERSREEFAHPECARLRSEIEVRDAEWEAALICARRRLGSRIGALRIRHARF